MQLRPKVACDAGIVVWHATSDSPSHLSRHSMIGLNTILWVGLAPREIRSQDTYRKPCEKCVRVRTGSYSIEDVYTVACNREFYLQLNKSRYSGRTAGFPYLLPEALRIH